MSELEELLRDLERKRAISDDARPVPELFELRMTVAAAHEFMAATERGDAKAAEFHAQLLEQHLHSAHTLRFSVNDEHGSAAHDRPDGS